MVQFIAKRYDVHTDPGCMFPLTEVPFLSLTQLYLWLEDISNDSEDYIKIYKVHDDITTEIPYIFLLDIIEMQKRIIELAVPAETSGKLSVGCIIRGKFIPICHGLNTHNIFRYLQKVCGVDFYDCCADDLEYYIRQFGIAIRTKQETEMYWGNGKWNTLQAYKNLLKEWCVYNQ